MLLKKGLNFSTECSFNYVVTENIAQFSESKTACEKLNGELASEDLKDRLLASFLKNIKLFIVIRKPTILFLKKVDKSFYFVVIKKIKKKDLLNKSLTFF